MNSRSALGTVLAVVLVSVAYLVWDATRSLGVERPIDLAGASESRGSEVPAVPGLEGSVDGGAARTTGARTPRARETEETAPLLRVEVASAGTTSPERPLPGATIHVAGIDTPLGPTDRAGRFEVELPAATEGVVLHVEATGHSRGSATVYVVDGVALARLTLQQIAVLVGRVRHADGTPAGDVRVAALTEEESRGVEAPNGPRRRGPGMPDTSTDEQGRFELAVIAGSWRLAASVPGGGDHPWGWTDPVQAVEGAETQVADLVIPETPAERQLRVRVLDPRRGAIAQARISYELVSGDRRVARGAASCDDEGRYVLVGTPGDEFEVEADAFGFGDTRAAGVIGGPELVLVLVPAPILDVVVRAENEREVEQELRWRLGRLGADGEEWLGYGTCPAERHGRFAATWPEGADVLEILASVGFTGERVSLPPAPSDGEHAQVTVVLREGLRVEGRVSGTARGLALPLVRVRRLSDGEGELPGDPGSWPRRGTLATRVREDGSFRLAVPEAGRYMIGVAGELRGPLVLGPYDVLAPPGVLGLEIELERPATTAEDE